jgi:uncharacterized SAM-binding protein YcdF (DUF218 family)
MIRGFLTAMILVALAYAVSFLLFVSLLPRTPTEIPQADGIVALTGGGERLDAAADLFDKGVGRRLLISGVAEATTKDTLKDMVHGGPRFDCCADLGYAAQDTHGNAMEAADWAHANGFKSLVIVTARYHMPRALNEFGRAMPGVRLEPYAVDQGRIDLAGWWQHPQTTLLLNREYVKYLASVVMRNVAG